MPREREDPEACGHNVAITEGEEGRRRARCLTCDTVGPERESGKEAVEALRALGGSES